MVDRLYSVRYVVDIVVKAQNTEKALELAAEFAIDECQNGFVDEVSEIESLDDIPSGWCPLSVPYSDDPNEPNIKEFFQNR
jgi:hypothetical protein